MKATHIFFCCFIVLALKRAHARVLSDGYSSTSTSDDSTSTEYLMTWAEACVAVTSKDMCAERIGALGLSAQHITCAGESLLSRAVAHRSDVACVEALLSEGGSNASEPGVLSAAVVSGNAAIASLLMRWGATPTELDKVVAASKCYEDMVELLFMTALDSTDQLWSEYCSPFRDKSAVTLTEVCGFIHAGERLDNIKLDPDGVNIPACPGPTTLVEYAAALDRPQAIQYVYGAGASVQGWRALALAAQAGAVSALSMLVALGADPDAASVSGATPLMYAAKECKQSTAEILLQKGADATASTVTGITALRLWNERCFEWPFLRYKAYEQASETFAVLWPLPVL